MNRKKDWQKTVAIALFLLFVISQVCVIGQSAGATTSFGMAIMMSPHVGVNSATLISWTPVPDVKGGVLTTAPQAFPVLTQPPYKGQAYVWPTATVTFTRPDNTTDVMHGPFEVRSTAMPGRNNDLVTLFTPNQKGLWTVNFYWPGDDKYNAVNNTYSFNVGDPIAKRETFAKLSLDPYPAVGLNQNILINAWVTPPPLTTQDFYENYTFTFTSPTGKSTVIGPMNSEGPGTVWFNLPLNELGNWSIKFDFPGDWFDLPCTVTRTITVQQNAVPNGYPDTPLPTDEWTFPINTQNREWRNIAGPWYQSNYDASMSAFNPYTEAPKTAHVLWKIASTDIGGQLGGYMGSPHSIQTGGGVAAYDAGDAGLFSSTTPTFKTVMAGRGYFTANGMIYCVDMRTGDTLWNVPGSFDVGSRRGQTAALYSFSNNRFIAYDAITGGLILNVTGMSMAFYQEPYVYSTVVGPERGQLGNLRFIKWDTSGTSNDFSTRILYNISIPYDLFVPWSIILSQNYLLSFAFEYPTSAATRMAAWNLTNGQLVYDVPIANVSDPNSWVIHLTPMGTGQGKLWLAGSPIENEGIGYVAFDVDTGKFAWTMEKPGDPWGNFWAYTPQANAYGMIYGLSYSGVYAINSTNGKIVWHYIANDTYSEEPYNSNIDPTTGQSYGSYSFGSIGAKIGGGVVFAPSSEHSPTFIYRGQSMYAIDAFTGKEIWSIKGAYSPCAVAYGILLAADTYNGVSYAFGKGDSATTVGVSSEVIPRSGTVLIKGSVLDMSTAQQGTPAIADQFQTAWMEYLHMQQPKPTNATGVPVVLTAVDATGKSTTIGTVTSDANGQYAFAWAPQTEGTYTIVASFGGSESYYASSAETAVAVSPAAAGSSVSPQPSTPSTSTSPSVSTSPSTSVSPNAPVSESPAVSPTQAPPSNEPIPTNTYLAIAAAVVIIAVLAAAIVLRKRKQ